jgi:hypothetical protein
VAADVDDVADLQCGLVLVEDELQLEAADLALGVADDGGLLVLARLGGEIVAPLVALDDCRLLVDRSKAQFDTLQGDIDRFNAANPVRIRAKGNTEAGNHTVQIDNPPRFPREWGLQLGELANNARSALDHLVYALAVEARGKPDLERTAFPIFQSESAYRQPRGKGAKRTTTRDTYLAGVDERWRDEVDALQPYHRGAGADLDPLAVLVDITNLHKHRLLKAPQVLIEVPIGFVLLSGSDPIAGIEVAWQSGTSDVDVSAQLTRTRSLTNPGFGFQPKAQDDGVLALHLVFGDPPRQRDLTQVRDAVERVAVIIRRFEPAFDPPVATEP